MTPDPKPDKGADSVDFWSSLRTGALIGAAALAIALPAWYYYGQRPVPTPSPTAAVQSQAAVGAGPLAQATVSSAGVPHLRLASFGSQQPTPAVREVANWSVHSGDHQTMAIVIVDKKDARVWVFDPQGTLMSSTPALLGSAIGDLSVPGIGEKPLAQVRPEEKTTPAGRFIAEPGVNLNGEDIVWVSYDLAVSLHRVRPSVKSEQRLERLASATSADNRISFGCINLPPSFFDSVLSPVVHKHGAVIYVLPETRTPAEEFGSYDVTSPASVALR